MASEKYKYTEIWHLYTDSYTCHYARHPGKVANPGSCIEEICQIKELSSRKLKALLLNVMLSQS